MLQSADLTISFPDSKVLLMNTFFTEFHQLNQLYRHWLGSVDFCSDAAICLSGNIFCYYLKVKKRKHRTSVIIGNFQNLLPLHSSTTAAFTTWPIMIGLPSPKPKVHSSAL
ncbi:hypothetical protein T09_3838 [Trichinella sp. T9]|nr:hypothetical protein T09_3838 [Trichinella sp. T9]